MKVGIVGRPNVGKSSLFNALLKKKRAIVSEIAGTTVDIIKDRLTETLEISDSPGINDEKDVLLLRKLLSASDRVLLVVDGTSGPVPLDKWFAQEVKRSSTPVLLVVNKSDRGVTETDFAELAFDESVAVSAAHRRNMESILSWLGINLDGERKKDEEPITLCFLGRPNAGKSTLMNQMAGGDISKVSPIPHTTRDTIAYDLKVKGENVRLLDTAGVRRPRSVKEKLESMSIGQTLTALYQSDVVLLMLNVAESITDQDLRLLDLVSREGKPALVLLNFWDLLSRHQKLHFKEESELWRHLKDFRTLPISAETGFQVDSIVPVAMRLYRKSQFRVKTSQLNQIVEKMVQRNPPPTLGHRNFNILYASQVRAKPPTFVFFLNRKGALPGSYQKYLENTLRSKLGFKSQPIRLFFRGLK